MRQPCHVERSRKLVPGFEFLQGLVKNAGSALPSIGQWVAPTLNPESWRSASRSCAPCSSGSSRTRACWRATIQALEVQRMTLSTLKTMNVQMTDLRESMKIRCRSRPARRRGTEPAEPDAAPEAGPQGRGARRPRRRRRPAVVDPMQWWGALTKQFTQLPQAP